MRFLWGENRKKKATFRYEEDNKYLFVEHVPADVCIKCGEKTYSPKVADALLRFAKDEYRPVKTIKVSVFAFAGKV